MTVLLGLAGKVQGYCDEDLTVSRTISSGKVIAEKIIDDLHCVIVEDLDNAATDKDYVYNYEQARTHLWGELDGRTVTVTQVAGRPHGQTFKVEKGSSPRVQGLADELRLRLNENGDIDVSGLCNSDVIALARAEGLI